MTEELTNMQNQIKEMQEDTLVNNAKKGLTNKGLRNIIRFSFIQGVNKYAARRRLNEYGTFSTCRQQTGTYGGGLFFWTSIMLPPILIMLILMWVIMMFF